MVTIDTSTIFNLTELTKYLNENFQKQKEGRSKVLTEFTLSDVGGYINRGYLPAYIKRGYRVNILNCKREDIKAGKLYQLELELRIEIDLSKKSAPKVPRKRHEPKVSKKKQVVFKTSINEEKIAEVLNIDATKKDKIIALANLGATRTEVIKLNFVDRTHVYDIYREKFPELCE